jgi:hypothetical protein
VEAHTSLLGSGEGSIFLRDSKTKYHESTCGPHVGHGLGYSATGARVRNFDVKWPLETCQVHAIDCAEIHGSYRFHSVAGSIPDEVIGFFN